MNQQAFVALLCSLLLLGLAGCSGQRSTHPGSIVELDYEQIISKFSYQLPPPVKAKEPGLKAPVDPLRRRLSHTDPLRLPESKFIIAGSDTLAPVTQSMIGRFHDDGFRGNFRMNQSSTGVGIKAMCRGETMDLVNASRMLKPKEEKLCEENGITPVQIKIGFDPFVLITNQKNFWMKSIRKEQLYVLFKSTRWSDLDPSYPYNPIAFFVPRKEGGAMEAMSKLVYGNKAAPYIREVKNGQFYPYNLELTRDLANETYGVGFASYGKLSKLKQLNVKVIPISGARPVTSGSAYPIKRSLYIITSTSALEKAEVQTFIAHYLNSSHDVMPSHGFAPLDGAAALVERRDFMAELVKIGSIDIHVTVPPE